MIELLRPLQARGALSLHLILGCLLIGASLPSCKQASKNAEPKIWRVVKEQWNDEGIHGKEQNIAGFSDDLLKLIGEEVGMQISLVNKSTPLAIDRLLKREVEAMVSTTLPQEETENRFDFTDPILYTGLVLVTPAESQVRSLGQLGNLRVGIEREKEIRFKVDEFPDVILISYDEMRQAVDDLVKGKLEALLMRVFPAQEYAQGFYRGSVRVNSPVLTDHGIRLIVLDSDHTTFVERFNRGLSQVRSDGRYDQLVRKWSLFRIDP